MSRILDNFFYTPAGSTQQVGIVVTQDEVTEERKVRVGIITPDLSENSSIRHVQTHGAEITRRDLKRILETIGDSD